jgi:ADP-sugar diphosphatase
MSVPAERKPALTLDGFNSEQLHPSIPVYLPHNLTEDEFSRLLPSLGGIAPQNPDPAFTFPALSNWLSRLFKNFKLQDDESHPFHKHPYKLRELDVQSVDWFWRNRPGMEDKLGFMKIQAKIETDPYLHEGTGKEEFDWIPGAVFLRGGSVAILVSSNPTRPNLKPTKTCPDHRTIRRRERRR